MRRILLGLAGVAAIAVGACSLLPERFAVNAPVLHMMLGVGGAQAPNAAALPGFSLPKGLAMQVYADDLAGVRFLRFSPSGALVATRTRAGEVVLLLPDADGDGRSDGRRVLLEGLAQPHGLDFHDGYLYVAETDGVGRVRYDASADSTNGDYARVVNGLPGGGNHYTRSLRFGPDGWMYVSIGSTCNVCEEADPRRAAMVRFRPDGSGEALYATGLRNSVGFDWQPGTDKLFATDNGRDLLGDDFPPCELNEVVEGGFYGWPYANGDRVLDPDLGAGHEDEVARSIAPVHGFRAHNAPLGMTFVRGDGLPGFRGAALVALHGSWNRTEKDGYSVVSLHWDGDGGIEERDFLSGFLRDGDVLGRPVDVAEGPDGAAYVSDDYAGAIYRVAPGTSAAAQPDTETADAERTPLADLAPAEVAAARAEGAALQETHACHTCHDPERAAAGVVPVPLEGLSGRYDVASLTLYLSAPTPPMPQFPLSESQRRALAIQLLDAHP